LNTKFLSGFLILLFLCSLFVEPGYANPPVQVRQKSGHDSIFSFFHNIWKKQDFISHYKDLTSQHAISQTYAHYMMGVIFDNQDQHNNAVKEFIRVQQDITDSENLYFRIASTYINMGEYAKAKDVIEKALELDEDSLKARFLLAILYLEQKDFESATREYENIIKADPYNILALSFLADVYVFEKKLYQALAVYNKLLEKNRFSPYLYFNLGLLYLKLNRVKDAEKDFKQSLLLRPDYLEPVIALGIIEELKQDYKKAVTYYKRAIDIAPADRTLILRLARAYFLSGSLGMAESEYKRAIVNYPDMPDAFLGLAEIYLRMEKTEEALSVLSGLLKIDGKNTNALLLTGIIYFDQQSYIEAIEYLSEVLDAEKENQAAYFYLGAANERIGQRVKAKEFLKKAIVLDSNDEDALNYLGYMYVEDNQYLDEAIRLIKRALKSKPKNGAFIDSLGWAYYKKGDMDRARELIKSALKIYGDDSVMYDHLGDIYNAMGKKVNAKKAWQRSLKLDSENRDVKEKLKGI